MSDRRTVSARAGKDADYAVVMEDDSLAPYVRAGGRAFLRRTTELDDGDTGLFYSCNGMVFRQYCSDSRGTVFLFSIDRSRKDEDLEFPPGSEMPVCYGRLLLSHAPELPQD
jgi:hypothetical protein